MKSSTTHQTDALNQLILLIKEYQNNVMSKTNFYTEAKRNNKYRLDIEKTMHKMLVLVSNVLYNIFDESIYNQIYLKLNLICHIQSHSNAFEIQNEYNKVAYCNIQNCLIERTNDLIEYCEQFVDCK